MNLELEQFPLEAYCDVQTLQRRGIEGLVQIGEEMPSNLDMHFTSYRYGDHFTHAEAYQFCSTAIIWPEYFYDPQRAGYVLLFDFINYIANQEYRFAFEEWFEENRVQIIEGAAKVLGKEIKTN